MYHIILLERDALRVENAHLRICPFLPLPCDNYSIFKAIDSKTPQIEQSIQRFDLITHKQYYLANANYFFNFTRGQLGCLLSHYSLWHNLFYQSTLPHYVILEDDCILDKSFQENVQNILSELPPDYDFCYLYVYDDHYKNTKEVEIPNKQYINRAYFTWTTLSYVVSRQGAQKLMNHFKDVDLPLDEKIAVLIKNGYLNAYSAKTICVKNNGCKNIDDPTGLRSNIWSSALF